MFARPENLNTIFIIIQEQLWDQVPILQRLRECYNLKKMVEVDVRYLLNQFSRTMDLTCFSTTRRVQGQCMEITYNSDCQIGKTMFNQIGTNFDLLTKATCLDFYNKVQAILHANNFRGKKTINAVGNGLKSRKFTKCQKFHYHKSEKCHEKILGRGRTEQHKKNYNHCPTIRPSALCRTS